MSAALPFTRPRWLASSVACAAAALAPACVPTYGFTAGATDGGESETGAPIADAGLESDTDARADSGAIAVDPGFPKVATIRATGADAAQTTISTTFDVPSGGRLLVAVVVWGQYGGAGVWPVSLDGGGLTWTSRAESVSTASYAHAVGVGVWTAWAASGSTGVTVTATRSNAVSADALFAVYSLAGASQTIGSTGTTNGFANAAPLGISLATVATGSFVALGLLDGNGNNGVRGSTLSNTTYDATLASGSGNGIAIGRLKSAPTIAGALTVGQDNAPVPNDVGAAVEILAQ